jgi:sugar phosphate isomerase/epimerase
MKLNRRRVIQQASVASLAMAAGAKRTQASESPFQFRYLLGSCLYGYEDVRKILPEVSRTGATAIDLWPKVHGNQREQLTELGEPAFTELLQQHGIELGCITQYPLGPFGLQEEMRLAKRLGCKTIVTGGKGPTNLKGKELKKAVADFVELMKPHLAVAEECGVTIAIENHAKNLIDHPDSLRYLAELKTSPNLGIAFAPYHLPQDEELLSKLLREIFPAVAVFYAWEHGHGCTTKLPKEEELMQMPGRGSLSFQSMVAVLQELNYRGWTEIFMHPFPRGIPILDTTPEVTTEINRARNYLEGFLRRPDFVPSAKPAP